MDRLRLQNDASYPFIKIRQDGDDIYIDFYKTVDARTLQSRYMSLIQLENKRGDSLAQYRGYDTIIESTEHSIHLRRYNYTDVQLMEQTISENEIVYIETQQELTEAFLNNIECEQDATDADLELIDQAQFMTEYELLLMDI